MPREALAKAKEFAKTLGPDLDVQFYRFDAALSQPKESDLSPAVKPKGRETRLGTAMLEAKKQQDNTSRRIARMVIISDFASNNGPDPLEVARQVKGRACRLPPSDWAPRTPGRTIATSESATSLTGPTVFVKNRLDVRGTLVAHGFANQQLNVELFVEGQAAPVAKSVIKVPDGTESVPITGISYIPQTPGEKRLTLKVAPQEGELVLSNNEISTFVTVLARRPERLVPSRPDFDVGLPLSDEGDRQVARHPGRGDR